MASDINECPRTCVVVETIGRKSLDHRSCINTPQFPAGFLMASDKFIRMLKNPGNEAVDQHNDIGE